MDKIICIGKNYKEHVAELGDPVPKKPVLFIKPPSVLRSALANDESLLLSLPKHSQQIHHELELVFRIDQDAYQVSVSDAERMIGAVTVGLDMTLRDLQTDAKKSGSPWTTGKVFRDAAVIGPWVPMTEFKNCLSESFTLELNGRVAQRATGLQMTFSPAECLSYASQFFPICRGDILFTGSPAGVGPVLVGDTAKLQFGPIRYSVRWTE